MNNSYPPGKNQDWPFLTQNISSFGKQNKTKFGDLYFWALSSSIKSSLCKHITSGILLGHVLFQYFPREVLL